MLEASFPSILRLAEKPGRQDQDPVGQDHHLHGIGDWLGTQDLPKLAMDILSLARLVQKMPWPAKMVLVNCPLPAWVAASFPQGWGKVLGCSQQAAMVAKVAKSSSWESSGVEEGGGLLSAGGDGGEGGEELLLGVERGHGLLSVGGDGGLHWETGG